MKTAKQNASSLVLYIGKTGALRCEYLSIDVTVADSKRSYGRTLLLFGRFLAQVSSGSRKIALAGSRKGKVTERDDSSPWREHFELLRAGRFLERRGAKSILVFTCGR